MKAPEITAMAIAIIVVCVPAVSSGFTIISVKKSGARTRRRSAIAADGDNLLTTSL